MSVKSHIGFLLIDTWLISDFSHLKKLQID